MTLLIKDVMRFNELNKIYKSIIISEFRKRSIRVFNDLPSTEEEIIKILNVPFLIFLRKKIESAIFEDTGRFVEVKICKKDLLQYCKNNI